jgi:predicted RNase H-like HicB family nuclease
VELTIVVRQEGPDYWSEIEQLPGCFASGGTLGELGEALGEAVALYLDQEVQLAHQPLRVGAQRAAVMNLRKP